MSKIKHLIDHAVKAWAAHPRGHGKRGKLNPGASMEQIHAVEKAINAHLPQSYKEFLHITNGLGFVNFGGYEILSTDQVLHSYNFQLQHINEAEDANAKPGPGVQKHWYNRRWLPIASLGNGDYLVIDYDPAPGGKKGQIVEFEHDSGNRSARADSFSAWLEKQVNKIESEAAANPAAQKQPEQQQQQAPQGQPAQEEYGDTVAQPVTGESNIQAVIPPVTGDQPEPTTPPESPPIPENAVPEGSNAEKEPEPESDDKPLEGFAAEVFGTKQPKRPVYAKW